MCGICGVVGERSEDLARAMVARLGHRGPDGSGVWAEGPVALGHTRLAILELSEAGAQPMRSASHRWVVSFNGEIFNHLELRSLLGGVLFRGSSDTETLLALLERFGFEATLERLVGMFAIAAWDRSSGRLYLARDRAGQKPLFYGFCGGHFAFGSELGVVRALPVRPSLDHDSLALMLRYNSIPAPRTVYQGLSKLPAASWVVYEGGAVSAPRVYWRPPMVASSSLDSGEVRSEVARLLEDSVRLRMLSDVPLGAFLSGGIDSSLIVGTMARLSSLPVRTFTIDFDDARFSEAATARAVAAHFGTEHTSLRVTGAEALALVPSLGSICDEPFGDSSLVPTLLLSELTRRHVTVALTGDGGDELFGGYHRQVWLPRILGLMRFLPWALRSRVGSFLLSSVGARWVSGLGSLVRTPGEKFEKLGHLLMDGGDLAHLYRSSLSQVRSPGSLVQGPVIGWVEEMAGVPRDLEAFDRVCLADFLFYMPTDVLVKVDRASMRYGLEARSPFLDHRLVEFAMGLDVGLKVRGGRGKWLLRSLLGELMPLSLVSGPKMGFAVPLAGWLRGPLRSWASDLLSSRWVGASGVLRGEAVRALWTDHLEGRARPHALWNVLMLLAWLEASE